MAQQLEHWRCHEGSVVRTSGSESDSCSFQAWFVSRDFHRFVLLEIMIVNYQLRNYVMLCNAEAGLAKSTTKDCKGGTY